MGLRTWVRMLQGVTYSPVYPLVRAWREHQVTFHGLNIRKGTFITDQQTCPACSEKELLVTQRKVWEWKLVRWTPSSSARDFLGFIHRSMRKYPSWPAPQRRWSSWFREEVTSASQLQQNCPRWYLVCGCHDQWTGYSLHHLWGGRTIRWAEPATEDLLDWGEDAESYQRGTRPRNEWASLLTRLKMVPRGDVDEEMCKNLLGRMIHCLNSLHYYTTSYTTFGYCIMSADVQHNLITNWKHKIKQYPWIRTNPYPKKKKNTHNWCNQAWCQDLISSITQGSVLNLDV